MGILGQFSTPLRLQPIETAREDDVYFCVLDIYGEILKPKVNVYHSPDLHAAKWSSRAYVHEYLVHGIIEGENFKTVSCDTLVEMGLYGLKGIRQILNGMASNDECTTETLGGLKNRRLGGS